MGAYVLARKGSPGEMLWFGMILHRMEKRVNSIKVRGPGLWTSHNLNFMRAWKVNYLPSLSEVDFENLFSKRVISTPASLWKIGPGWTQVIKEPGVQLGVLGPWTPCLPCPLFHIRQPIWLLSQSQPSFLQFLPTPKSRQKKVQVEIRKPHSWGAFFRKDLHKSSRAIFFSFLAGKFNSCLLFYFTYSFKSSVHICMSVGFLTETMPIMQKIQRNEKSPIKPLSRKQAHGLGVFIPNILSIYTRGFQTYLAYRLSEKNKIKSFSICPSPGNLLS